MTRTLLYYSICTWFRIRGAIAGPLLFLATTLAVELSFWHAVGQSTGTIGHYTTADMLAYSCCALITSQVIACIGEPDALAQQIETGDLDRYLVRPLAYLRHLGILQLGMCLARLLLLVPLACVALTLLQTKFSWQLPWLMLLTLPGAAILNALLNQMIGTLTFYFRDSYAFVQFKETMFWILTGALLPLDFFPHAISQWLLYCPPAYLTYYPVQVMLGRMPLLPVLVGQLAWGLVAYGFAMLGWRRGVQHYQAYGG